MGNTAVVVDEGDRGDLAVRARSTRQSARANVAIFQADNSSGLSPIKKKTRPSPPSPYRAVVARAPASVKSASARTNAVAVKAAAKKRLNADADFADVDGDFEIGADQDSIVDEDSIANDGVFAQAVVASAKPVSTKGKAGVSANLKKSALPAPPVVAAVPDEAADVFRLVSIEREANRCTCVLLVKLVVKDLKAICKKLVPPVNFRERVNNVNRDMRKKLILVELCRVCNTEDEVVAALAGAGYVQGVAPRFWHPRVQPDAMSLLSAFHHAMQRAADEGANEGIREVLGEFRAHFARMLLLTFVSTSWKEKSTRSTKWGSNSFTLGLKDLLIMSSR